MYPPPRYESHFQCVDAVANQHNVKLPPNHPHEETLRICTSGLISLCFNLTSKRRISHSREFCESAAWHAFHDVFVPDELVYFNAYDWMHSQKSCLPSEAELCKLKSICNRAAVSKEKPTCSIIKPKTEAIHLKKPKEIKTQ